MNVYCNIAAKMLDCDNKNAMQYENKNTVANTVQSSLNTN